MTVAVPIDGVSSPLPATGQLPAAPAGGAPAPTGGAVAPAAVAAPAALPFTGVALSAALLFGLVLVTGGTALTVAGRRRPAHALPGFWSR